jgi:hypothetical protein
MKYQHATDLLEHLEEFDFEGPVLDRLQLAKALLQGANELLYHAARETKDENAMGYIVNHLGTLIGHEGSRSRAPSVSDWIERLEENSGDDQE